MYRIILCKTYIQAGTCPVLYAYMCGMYNIYYNTSPGVTVRLQPLLYASRAMSWSWLPELYSRLPVGRQSAGSWLSRASYGFVKTFLYVRVWLRLYILYRAFAMFPVCKDSLLSSYRWCAGWCAGDSCWLAGFWGFIMFTIVLRSSIIVNIITCWLANFFVNKSKKVWWCRKIIVPLQPKRLI